MPALKSVAIHVCSMNNTPTSTKAITVARPTEFNPPRVSSAKVEMPSKPKNDSTAIEVAPAIVAMEKTCGS